MSNTLQNFGQTAHKLGTVTELIQAEREVQRHLSFVPLDFLVGRTLVRILQEQTVIIFNEKKPGEDDLALQGLTPDQKMLLDSTFLMERQQARGAWYIPEQVSLKLGSLVLPASFRQYGHFGSGIAREMNGKVSLAQSPAAVLVWSILEPLCSTLFLPFELRGHLTGTKSQQDQLELWAEVNQLLEVLGFSLEKELAVMRYGGGWHQLRADAQFEAKRQLLAAMAMQVHPLMPIRYRLYRIQRLMEQHYKKSKGKPVKRRQVLTKVYERTLSGYFGGDWLTWLEYLGEQPHPDEEIVTAMPASRLQVGSIKQIGAISVKHGVPAEEIQKIAATFWQQPVSKSPVEQRVEVLTTYWQSFDQVHAQQKPGMKPLWGLVQEHGSLPFKGYNEQFEALLYQELLPAQLRADIENLWGTVMLSKWPERIVSEPFPHSVMASTLGPALKFWHGCALTAWFLCEGPYSRTDMEGLETYHAKELARLEELGAPVAPKLFGDLIKAQAKLDPPTPIESSRSSHDVGYGISVTFSTQMGMRRSGFNHLRDIITTYRRAWTEQHFPQYLRALWESEIKEAELAYNLLVNQKGKPPTAKQFAPKALAPTNHWFGGNLSNFFAAIREKSPVVPVYEPRLPADRIHFALEVFRNLGGKANQRQQFSDTETQPDSRLENLARQSLKYAQLEEALGQPPSLKEFGSREFGYYSAALDEDSEKAWGCFVLAIERAIHSSQT